MTKQRKAGSLPRCKPPADNQIIVWIEDEGKPVVLAIFDEVMKASSTTQRDTYKSFVQRFGLEVAETAVRLYQMGQADQ